MNMNILEKENALCPRDEKLQITLGHQINIVPNSGWFPARQRIQFHLKMLQCISYLSIF